VLALAHAGAHDVELHALDDRQQRHGAEALVVARQRTLVLAHQIAALPDPLVVGGHELALVVAAVLADESARADDERLLDPRQAAEAVAREPGFERGLDHRLGVATLARALLHLVAQRGGQFDQLLVRQPGREFARGVGVFAQVADDRAVAAGGHLADSTDIPARFRCGSPCVARAAARPRAGHERSNVQLPKQRMDLQRIHRQQEMLTRVLERFGMVAP
jgi:hypothetical protein